MEATAVVTVFLELLPLRPADEIQLTAAGFVAAEDEGPGNRFGADDVP